MSTIDIAERAAVLEYDHRMSRADAETQAVREAYDGLIAEKRSGILGELAQAERTKSDPQLATILTAMQLDRSRAPAWGFQHIIVEGDTYRPAIAPNEFGMAAVFVAVSEGDYLVDLVAATLDKPEHILSRVGIARCVGFNEVGAARFGFPLLVFSSLLAWIKGGGRGAVVVDWSRVGHELDGVQTILCSASIAHRLHASTRKCFPRPTIAVPSKSMARYAA